MTVLHARRAIKALQNRLPKGVPQGVHKAVLYSRLKQRWQAAPPFARAAATLVAVMTVGSLAVRGYFTAGPSLSPIYHGVSIRDAAEIDSLLQPEHINARYDTQTTDITVPSGDASRATMIIEAAGILPLDVAGLNSPSAGASLIQEQRAAYVLQRQLVTQIKDAVPILGATVNIALAQMTAAGPIPPAASVIVTLPPGRTLTASEVATIVGTVALNVPGLTTNNVVLVDQSGLPLWRNEGRAAKALRAHFAGKPG